MSPTLISAPGPKMMISNLISVAII